MSTPVAMRSPAAVRGRRGFTLIELMVVIAMIGIMAAIAIVGYQKYIQSAHTGDAKAVISSIRIAQEAHRAETLTYRDCGTMWYPQAAPSGMKMHFINPGHADWPGCWMVLNVINDSPTRYVYVTQAVAAGGMVPTAVVPGDWSNWPGLPANAIEPTFVIEASGDNNEDGNFSRLMTSSYNGEIFVEDEYE